MKHNMSTLLQIFPHDSQYEDKYRCRTYMSVNQGLINRHVGSTAVFVFVLAVVYAHKKVGGKIMDSHSDDSKIARIQ